MNRFLWTVLLAASVHGAEPGAIESPATGGSSPRIWRSGAHGGINVLYPYLRIHGVPCAYSDLANEQSKDLSAGRETALTLVQIAATKGMKLRAVSLTPEELLKCRLPVIVHVDDDSPDQGSFLLILGMTDHWIDYMHGPTATIYKMQQDDFRRCWSGVALVPASNRWKNLVCAVAGLGLGLLLTLSIPGWTARKLRIRAVSLWLVLGSPLIPMSSGAQTNQAETKISLPPGVRTQLDAQAVAMAAVHLEYRHVRASDAVAGYAGESEFSEYFVPGRFYRLEKDDDQSSQEAALDGPIFYCAVPPAVPFAKGREGFLQKARIDDMEDPIRNMKRVVFYYLHAASFYAPETMMEMRRSSSISSLVSYYLDQYKAVSLETVGERLRITFEIPDSVLMAAREIDLEKERKALERQRAEAKTMTNLPSDYSSKQFVDSSLQGWKQQRQLMPTRTVTFVLDPEKGYAVIQREERTAAGKLIVRVDSDRWKHYADKNIWLPHRCVETYFTHPDSLLTFYDKPHMTATCVLSEVEFDPDTKEIQFALEESSKYKLPRTSIEDRSTAEARTKPTHRIMYEVKADASDLRRITDDVAAEMEAPRPHLVLMIVVAVLLLAPAIMWSIWRKKPPIHA